ncbi:hypothetical protein WICANDRAFT_27237 [Wickerhamomyces anomalus NRRL Y-366-8]|uniref:N-acetyltransferase domain-containing protein n=1 Tax=Wickerhamomyces anomalus (strain ATCC 58044 / CBS 1984 / NCYC 433 / NRRL Y-366-8) TaxID=683960 RepID=A0A1E3PCH5_WICAA|nr:uncharacterized protein WICANDRAFT_27237 [Wickerhamomyces anomalus NRRL Y-366-8]ODQ62990.1 hypothetical protein WICANDRAFT_27237 [Wickerhamomyces anomalus NRRL Y-366-8]
MTDYRPDQHFHELLPPYTVLLKDGETTATIYPIHNSTHLPPGLLAFLADEFNMEVERGDTFPFFDTLGIEEFKNYWFGAFSAVMVLGDEPQLDRQRQWEKECLGSFFIKANFPGRSSHICTGGFLVNAGIRGKGIGKTLTECFLDWAPKLGFTSAVFNLIFETNVGTRRIFESLNFKRIGKIKAAGILKGNDSAVDAIIYGKELVHPTENIQGTYRFDKIKYYLETGRYPPMIDRQEKSRLRSSASHYRLVDGKLTLNGKEVVSDPVKQLEICTQYHLVNHGGINKTTSAITDRFHWTRIKDTVAQAIRNCDECRDPTKSLAAKKKRENITLVNNRKRQRQGSQQMDGHSESPTHSHADSDPSSHLHRTDPSLLQADLTNLDDPSGIFAAVEAAQRQRSTYNDKDSYNAYQQQSRQPLRQQFDNGNNHYNQDSNNGNQRDDNDDIPVDPEVSAFDEHVQSGEEIEIARALIQANESVDPNNGQETDDNDLFN